MWPMIESKLSVLGDMGVGTDDFKSAEASNYSAPESGGKQVDIMNFFTAKSRGGSCDEEGASSSKKPRLGS